MSERRATRRYDLSFPVTIRVASHRRAETQKGKTRDVSTRGIYFVIDQHVPEGSELDMTMMLPTEMERGTEVLVRATGKILRVEPRLEGGSARLGVAAMIERYDIVRNDAIGN